MPISVTPETDVATNSRLAETARVTRELEAICVDLGVGGRLPRHTELMQQLGASQYTIIRVLEDLQRAGRVVRRHGSGTYVTDPSVYAAEPPVQAVNVAQTTVVAMSRPDGGFFDHCLELLYEETIRRGLGLACHFLAADNIGRFDASRLGRPAGFIAFRHDLAPLARDLQALGNRVVLVGAPHIGENFGVPCVCGNHERGAYLLTKHLIDLGHRNIGYIDASGALPGHSRWQGHSKMLADAKRAGVRVSYKLIDGVEFRSWVTDPLAAKAYLNSADAPTALVPWNDLEALSLTALLARAGVSVPNDVSVVGFDNDDDGIRVFPTLTTIDHSVADQIAAAVDMLFDDKPPSANERLIFAPTLVVRESSGKPRPLQVNSPAS